MRGLSLSENGMPAKPMKGVYTRFNTRDIEIPKPGVVRICQSMGARAFCVSCLVIGAVMAVFGPFDLEISLAAGGLVIAIGIIGMWAWSGEVVLKLDRENGQILCESSVFGREAETASFPLSSVFGIEVLEFVIEAGTAGWQDGDITVTGYELNLVEGPGNRIIHLLSTHSRARAQERACRIAETLGIRVLSSH